MAQILIRKASHFAEMVQPPEWDARKWAGRPLRGDIVEVRENDYWRIEALGRGIHGWDRNAFALIEIRNLSLQQAALYQGGYWSEDKTVQFKARYRLPNWETQIPWIKTMVTVGDPPVTVEEWYYIRSNIHAIVTPQDKVA